MQNSGKYPSSPRKISPSQFNMKQNSAIEEPDPGQLLNEWLGELDNLQKVNSDLEKDILNSQFWTSIDAELLNVSIRRIRLFSRILLNKKNRRKFNL